MSVVIFLRGIVIPIFYTGVGFLGATLYNKYNTEEKEIKEIKEEIKGIKEELETIKKDSNDSDK